MIHLNTAIRILYLWLAVAVASLGGASTAWANCTAVSVVNLTTQLKFPTLTIPAGSTTYTISGTDGATSGTGTIVYGAAGTRGQYLVRRTSGTNGSCANIIIDVTNVVTGNPNLTLTGFTGRYNNANLTGNPPWTVTALPTNAGRTLFLGATATYNGSIPAGGLTPTFNITLTYQGHAATLNAHSAAMSFDSPITISNVVNINFGVVKAMTAGTYVINTANSVTASGGGEKLYGAPVSGSMLIRGSATQTISISAGSYVAGGIGNGVTLSAATCSYNGGVAAACSLSTQAAPSQAGKTLLLGVTATVNASQTQGSTASPSFTVTVTYT